MRRISWTLGPAIVAALLSPAAGLSQVFTPTYMSPVPLNDVGVYISDGPGDMTLEGIWRGGPLGLRVGFVDARADDLLSVGAELRNPIALTGSPLGLAFTAGAQGLIGDADAIGLQVGLSAGHRFRSPGLAVTPYLHPRIAFVNGFGPENDFDTDILADIGVDVEIPANLVFRIGIGLADESPDWGIGLAWRM